MAIPVTATLTVQNTSGESGSPLSPGVWWTSETPIFELGTAASAALEALAETGDPSALGAAVYAMEGVSASGLIGDRNNADYESSPILDGQMAEERIRVNSGEYLYVAFMVGKSNDTVLMNVDAFVVPRPEDDELSLALALIDVGTEVNEVFGEGQNQPSNAPGTDSGEEENGVLTLAGSDIPLDAAAYPVRLRSEAR